MEKLNVLNDPSSLNELAKLIQIKAVGSKNALGVLEFPIYHTSQQASLQQMTYTALNARAKTIGGAIQEIAKPGQSALLFYTSGKEYLSAFFACLYVGVTAIPVNIKMLKQHPENIVEICKKHNPTLFLSSHSAYTLLKEKLGNTKVFQKLWPLSTDFLRTSNTPKWREPVRHQAVPAILDYDNRFLDCISDIVANHAGWFDSVAMGTEVYSAFTLSRNVPSITLTGSSKGLFAVN